MSPLFANSWRGATVLDDVERRLFVRALSVTPETFGESTEHDPEELFRMFLATGERLFEMQSGLTSEELIDRVLSAESPSQVMTVIESATFPTSPGCSTDCTGAPWNWRVKAARHRPNWQG